MHRTERRHPTPDVAIVVGGGRWAEIWCRVIASTAPKIPLHQVSPSLFDRSSPGLWCGAAIALGSPYRLLWPSVATLAAEVMNGTGWPSCSAVGVVANAPADHHRAARDLLRAGVHTMVEKPFTLDHAEAVALIDLAAARSLALLVDHELLFASYLHQLRTERGDEPRSPDRIEVTWHDVERELRYGVPKAPDISTSVVGDVLPHVCSVLRVVAGPQTFSVVAATSDDGGRRGRVELRHGPTPVMVSLDRRAAVARRHVLVQTGDDHLELDFTVEPGVIRRNGRVVTADGRWDQDPKPLTSAFEHLVQAASTGHPSPLAAADNLDLLAVTLDADRRLHDSAFAHLSHAIVTGADPGPYRHSITRDLSRDLVRLGLVGAPDDHVALEHLAVVAYDLIAAMANDPFVSLETLAVRNGLDQSTLRGLTAAIRRSSFCQRLLVDGGRGRKYLTNTILPVLRSGALEAALRHRPHLPFRIGLYPGQSCMFTCSFCGRNPTASYQLASVDPGTRLFERLLAETGPDDPNRFYLSGGLEPLTNQHLGRLVAAGSDAGHALSLYTNGFMLTRPC